MARTIEAIIEDLNALTPADFDLSDVGSNGNERLYALTQELIQTQHPEQAMDSMFSLFERFPDPDERLSLGTPGPLVHTLEKLDYQAKLIESLRRKPNTYTVWMINRILNTELSEDQRVLLLGLLEEAQMHPSASADTKRAAQNYLEYQKQRKTA